MWIWKGLLMLSPWGHPLRIEQPHTTPFKSNVDWGHVVMRVKRPWGVQDASLILVRIDPLVGGARRYLRKRFITTASDSATIDIDPKHPVTFDFVAADHKPSVIQLCFCKEDGGPQEVEARDYTMVLEAQGKDVKPTQRNFRVSLGSGRLHITAASTPRTFQANSRYLRFPKDGQ